MQTAHAIHGTAATDGQIGHVKTLRSVVWILAAQGQQIAERNTEFPGITAEVLLDERRTEPVKPGGDSRVRGEEIARPGGGQCHVKSLPIFLHEVARAFQYRKGRMTFI